MKLTIVHGHQEEIKGPVSKFVNVYRRRTGNMNGIFQVKKESLSFCVYQAVPAIVTSG